MRLVVLESPYAGDVERNVRYARAAVRDCLDRGEAPIASHLLYTQPGVLDDLVPAERAMGIEAGLLVRGAVAMRIRVAKLDKVERLGWVLVGPHPDGGWVVEKRVDGCVILDTVAALLHDQKTQKRGASGARARLAKQPKECAALSLGVPGGG